MSVRGLEAELNRRRQEINPRYVVKSLKRLPSGEHWFDLAMGFNARDMAKASRVFAELLGSGRRKPRETVGEVLLAPGDLRTAAETGRRAGRQAIHAGRRGAKERPALKREPVSLIRAQKEDRSCPTSMPAK